jgi:hypothetical protein
MLVDIDEVIPGTVDETTGAVTYATTADAVGYGVVDELVLQAPLTLPESGALRVQATSKNASRKGTIADETFPSYAVGCSVSDGGRDCRRHVEGRTSFLQSLFRTRVASGLGML